MRRRWFLLVLGLSVLLSGCGGGGGGGGTNDRFATVIGIVRDSLLEDKGLSGATIEIGGSSGTTTTLDQATADREVGSFQLNNVLVGSNVAKVTLPGGEVQNIAFFPSIGPGTNADVEIIVNIGQVTGKVVDSTGAAVRDASVYLTADGPSDSVTTNADGFFLIQNVLPGTVELTAVNGTQSLVKTGVVVNKGVTDVGTLTLVEDPNPNPQGPPRTIFGKVTLGPDNTAGSNTVLVLLRNGAQFETQTTNSDGLFQFYVPVGTYTLRTLRDGFVAQEATVTIVDANKPIEQNFTIQPTP
ncbi:MAG: carboxypeptidase-like regulatory domain-containing protein [Armatimonas sp.]